MMLMFAKHCTYAREVLGNGNDVPMIYLIRGISLTAMIIIGDHDLQVTFLGTQAWIRSLNYSIVDDWRQWHTNEQVAGYTRTYSNGMTFATGAGHTAPEYLPEECFAMFSRWISKRPL
ncbi:serine carboxypeptidase-like protein [Trifolium pratense]|uniref:Serine carboxypeptidase-like protein n=1 Tax=Trifolium pratense TaxID=57577 RepID=A0A2K3NS05_TRIPR|nr:serine carboxypeptidase-like protein [Trifolium pratense]